MFNKLLHIDIYPDEYEHQFQTTKICIPATLY
jgi:hypothetical protein